MPHTNMRPEPNVPEESRSALAPPRASRQRVAEWLEPFCLLLIGFAAALYTRADADLWGHLRYGLDIIDTWEIPLVDPYSFTQDKPWFSHEWLSELQMAAAYRLGGLTGLLALKAAMLCVVFAIIWHRWRGATIGARLGVLAVVAMGTIHMSSSVRPQLWTFLCLALLLVGLQRERPAQRWWLPAVFTFWVNCHGGWVVGLGVLGAWATAEVWQSPHRWREWGLLVSACVLATLIHPSGAGIWYFLGTTVRMTREIDEWQPLWTTPWLNWIPWVVATTGVAYAWRHQRHRGLTITLTLLMLAYAAFRVQRIESLFVAAAALLLGPTLSLTWPRRVGDPAGRPLVPFMAALALAAVALVLSARVANDAVSCVPIVASWAPDVRAMAALRHTQAGRIVTSFNWGQYVLWHVGPRVRVSIDGRREAIYSDRHLREHEAVMQGRPEGLAILRRWNPEYAWLPKSSDTTIAWMIANGYRADVDTRESAVLVRDDLPRLPAVEMQISDPPCFPG